MNLVVTDKCTNSCPYCFASSEMSKSLSLNILSKSNIDKIIDFIKRGEPNFELNIIGGEPFIYKDLGFLLSKLFNVPNFKKATIFTGGVFPSNKIEQILPYRDQIAIMVNLNEEQDYRGYKEYEKVIGNITKFLSLGIQTNIGFNIYRKNFNYTEIIEVCTDFGVEHLRWTIACPELNQNSESSIIGPLDYTEISPRVFDFLQVAYFNKIDAYLDCPIPKCFFSDEQLGRIALIQPRVLSAMDSCNPVIDVTPDLSVFRCFALSSIERKKITDFENLTETIKWYNSQIDERQDIPYIFSRCSTCDYSKDRTCRGGCIANNPKSLQRYDPMDSYLERAHHLLTENKFEEFEEILKMVTRKDAMISLLTAYFFEKKGDKKNAMRFARMTINRSASKEVKENAMKLISSL